MSESNDDEIIQLTTDIVASFVSNQTLRGSELPDLIRTVHSALKNIGEPHSQPAPTAALTPAVPVKKSIADDYIICLDDGKKFKSLKRHIAAMGMTPDDYRTKWGLPRDYPMVAPGYAAKRSALARTMGLGRARRQAEPALTSSVTISPAKAPAATLTPKAPQAMEAEPPLAKRRGRPKKAA